MNTRLLVIISIGVAILGAAFSGYFIFMDHDAPMIVVEDDESPALPLREKPASSEPGKSSLETDPMTQPENDDVPATKPGIHGNGVSRGVVQAGDVSPIPLAHMFLTGRGTAGNEHYACTQTDGSYEFAHLADGNYVLEARHKSFAPRQYEIAIRNGVTDFDGVVTLHNGGMLEGRVSDFVTLERAQEAKQGLTVELSMVNAEDFLTTSLTRAETPEVLLETFFFDRLPPGTWNVLVKYQQKIIAGQNDVVIEKDQRTQLELSAGMLNGVPVADTPATIIPGAPGELKTERPDNGSNKSKAAHELFVSADKNGDGYLDKAETIEQGSYVKDQLLDDYQMRALGDTDGDGRISKKEYLEYVSSLRPSGKRNK